MIQGGVFAPSTTTIKEAPLAQIDPAYTFESIFRNPAQEQFYISPYGNRSDTLSTLDTNLFPLAAKSGGYIDTGDGDDIDELLRIIGD